MEVGSIKIAEHEGVYVIKMVGDVRLTLCLSFDRFIRSMLEAPNFCSAMFDLSDAIAIDSTTLGLMAKISILSKDKCSERPLVVTSSPSIKRLLVSMGFEDIFSIVDQEALPLSASNQLGCDDELDCDDEVVDEDQVRKKVVEAHRVLMGLNESNSNAFKELVETLEANELH